MRLPYDLLSQSYKKPDIYLCDVDKSPMCKLNVTGARGSFKFNAYSELSFETSRTYLDTITGETKINPFYDKIETPRLIKLDGFGYFEIQGPESTNNGIKESRTVTAYSLEYTLSTKYLENFQINTGASESVEVGYAYDTYYEQYGDDYINYIAPVTLCNDANPRLSLLHLAIEKAYGWKIGHVDASLKTLSRKFEVARQSIYDFLMNEVCKKFNCYIIFDTENNTINVYAESKTSKFIGDGRTNKFTISPKFDAINTVSVDGYKTTKWSYNASTGVITLEDTPASGTHIEVIDGALTEWETDVFITYENLAQEIKVSYDSDEIKTQLKVTYGDDLDIREANLGIPYLTDLSYYYTVDWMGQDLYDAYTAYVQKSQNSQSEYKKNAQDILEIANKQEFEEHRLSLEYAIAQVGVDTVGTYYVRGGSSPNYYYTEVSLPTDYDASITYYTLDGTNINEDKVNNLYEALKYYFKNDSVEELNKLANEFKFMDTAGNTLATLSNTLKNTTDTSVQERAINKFLDEMWNQVGRTPLKTLYQDTFKEIQTTHVEAGWDKEDAGDEEYQENHYRYYTSTLFVISIDKAIKIRDAEIKKYQEQYDEAIAKNATITDFLAVDKNFTENQLIRLSAFIREDELQLDDIVETDEDTIADSFKIKEDAIESGRIELHKLSQPKLQFSMTMANIYALKDFEPIIDQFQLGNVIKVGLRKDYIKQSRLLQVDLEFDNLASLSTEFGELTDLRTQSDIHADLLGQAISAGKSVAQNSANWTKGSDTATSTDLRIQNGLLDAATVLKSIDATQGVEMSKYGIKMTKVNDNGEVDPKQGWLVNNMFAYTDDNWKTTKTVLGEFQLRGESSPRWGLLADAVIAGYVEGSHIIGGDIKIGDIGTNSFPFQVNTNGDMVATSATIKGDSSIAGWNVTDKYIDSTVSNTKKRLYLASASDSSTNWICATNSNGTNTFYVTKEGKVYAKSGEIGGWSIDANKISGWDDADKCFAKMDKSAIGQSGEYVFGVYNGSKWPFYVDGVGKLHATEATIDGTITTDDITATGGSIKTCTINNCTIDTASIPNLDASKITSGEIDTKLLNAKVITTDNFSSKTLTTGKLTVTDGAKIGNWAITNSMLYGKNGTCEARMNPGAIGTEGHVVFGAYDGSKWSAYIDGAGGLYATKGNIGGCTFDGNGRLQVANANIGSLSVDKITTGTNNNAVTFTNINSTGGTIENLTITGKLYFGGNQNYYIDANYNDSSYYLNLPGLKIDAASRAVFSGELSAGTVIGGDLKMKGEKIWLETLDNGESFRICDYNRNNYFWVSQRALYVSCVNTDRGNEADTLSMGASAYATYGYPTYFSSHGGMLGGTWYSKSAISVVSDKNKKNTIEDIGDVYDSFYDKLRPVTYKYNDGTSGRLHTGFISQETEEALVSAGLTTKDFAGVVIMDKSDGTQNWHLRYQEFISLNTWQIQKLKTRVAELENRLAALEERN